MKQILLKTWLTMLCLLVFGGGQSWAAEEVTIASFSNSSNTGWTVSGSPSYSNSGGYQLVSSTMSITTPSITFSNYSNITITIKCRKYGGPNSTQGKISVRQGDTELATYSPGGTTLANSSALPITPSDGKLVISCPGASSSKGCGISEIVIKGTPKDDISEPTPVDASWTVSPASVSVEAGKQAAVTITTDYDGELSVSSNASSIATASISGNTITVNGEAEGTATLTISGSATTNFNAISETIEVTVTAAQGGEDEEGVFTAKKESFNNVNGNLDTNILYNSYTGGAGTAPGNYNNGIRLYQISGTAKYGGYIEITAKEGYKINSVKLTSTNTYATTFNYSVDGGSFVWETNQSLAKSSSYTINSLNNSKVTIYNTGTGSSGRLEIAALEVKYVAVPEATEFKYTLDIVGEGTVKFVDGEDNEVNAGDDIAKGTEIISAFTPATGYEFTSWEYFSTSENEWKIVEGNKFTITKDVDFRVTFSKIKQKNAVAIVATENGTLTIKDGETIINDGDLVEEGTTLTVVVEANDGYRFRNWGYKDGDANWVGNNTVNFTHVMPAAPCQFKATFEAIQTYTVSWSINGKVEKSETVYEGTAVSAPTVEEINGKAFVGWATTSSVDAETGNLVTPSATATADATYYAVYATKGEGSEGATYTKATSLAVGDKVVFGLGEAEGKPAQAVTGANSGATISATESEWIVYTATTYEGKNGIVLQKEDGDYQRSAGGNFDFTSDNPSTFETNASSYIIGYGTWTLYSTPQGNRFYSNKQEGYVEFLMWKVEGGVSYSDFTTAPLGIAKISIGQYEYATLVAPCNLDLEGTGVTAYAITSTDLGNSVVRTTEVTKVPAGKPIIVHGAQGDYNIHGIAEADDFETMLEASESVVVYGEDTANDYYYLGVNGNNVCFKKLTSGSLAAGKCFFKIAKGSEVKVFSMIFNDDDATGISSVEKVKMNNGAVYNLAGQRVNANAKGIVIVNGKKMLNK